MIRTLWFSLCNKEILIPERNIQWGQHVGSPDLSEGQWRQHISGPGSEVRQLSTAPSHGSCDSAEWTRHTIKKPSDLQQEHWRWRRVTRVFCCGFVPGVWSCRWWRWGALSGLFMNVLFFIPNLMSSSFRFLPYFPACRSSWHAASMFNAGL